MKTFITFLVVLVVIFSAAEAHRDKERDGNRLIKSSSTFIKLNNNEYRFCIPVGIAPKTTQHKLDLLVRTKEAFSVRFDTNMDVPLTVPATKNSKVKVIGLVQNGRTAAAWHPTANELAKSGTISGVITTSSEPKWILASLESPETVAFPNAAVTCLSVLGVESKEADFKHGGSGNKDENNGDHNASNSAKLRKIWLMFGGSLSIVGILIGVVLIALIALRHRALKNKARNEAEMALVNNEENDLALAIERSLAEEEKKVVEIQQPPQAAPQFIFVPPQFMPQMANGGADTPYVPMFHPSFVSYGFEDNQ